MHVNELSCSKVVVGLSLKPGGQSQIIRVHLVWLSHTIFHLDFINLGFWSYLVCFIYHKRPLRINRYDAQTTRKMKMCLHQPFMKSYCTRNPHNKDRKTCLIILCIWGKNIFTHFNLDWCLKKHRNVTLTYEWNKLILWMLSYWSYDLCFSAL